MKPGRRHLGHAELTIRMPSPELGVSKENVDKLRELTHFTVADLKRRGQGHGSRLLQKVCREADERRKALMVRVLPYDEPARTTEQLMQFYERYGFVTIQLEPDVLMVRQPKGILH